jgi:hypothetical protein
MVMGILSLFCKRGTTHKTLVSQEKQKKYFQETFFFIANKLFELSKCLYTVEGTY